MNGGSVDAFVDELRRKTVSPILVAVKMIVRLACFAIVATSFALSISCTAMKRWCISSTVTEGDSTSCNTGSCWYRCTSESTTPSSVAENSSV